MALGSYSRLVVVTVEGSAVAAAAVAAAAPEVAVFAAAVAVLVALVAGSAAAVAVGWCLICRRPRSPRTQTSAARVFVLV